MAPPNEIRCPACGQPVSTQASACPECGQALSPTPSAKSRRMLYLLLILIAMAPCAYVALLLIKAGIPETVLRSSEQTSPAIPTVLPKEAQEQRRIYLEFLTELDALNLAVFDDIQRNPMLILDALDYQESGTQRDIYEAAVRIQKRYRLSFREFEEIVMTAKSNGWRLPTRYPARTP